MRTFNIFLTEQPAPMGGSPPGGLGAPIMGGPPPMGGIGSPGSLPGGGPPLGGPPLGVGGAMGGGGPPPPLGGPPGGGMQGGQPQPIMKLPELNVWKILERLLGDNKH
jgi:hypothetical protein